ncbi:MAG: glycine--tRNA ligase, partial [Clostridia bacterium]|nr:glycine--tRNA ligase [Clostridia bacterium]
EEMDAYIASHEDVICPNCGKHHFTSIRKFNLMFKTQMGVTEDSSSTVYMRPETAQGIFVNFANIQRTTRKKLPFGVCQVGKAFRNEITPGNFTFRTREFEQMECEFFCQPGTDLEWFAYWKDFCKNWLISLGIKEESLRLRDHDPAELAFYSRATTDIEYQFPFGVCQIGKSFRNEITPGNFIFRIREFEQMELEFFCKPDTDLEWFAYWRAYCHDWLKSLNIREENLRLRDHESEELSFYSKATTDFEYLFPFGWGELWGVADRTNYDLSQHAEHSGQDLTYFDPETNEHYIPYVVEPSLGADRMTLALLCEAYDEEVIDEAKNDTRVVMRFHPTIAPFKVAVLPLSKKLSPEAMEVYTMLSKDFMTDFDETGSIGKRYRREDEIGTPLCVTYDFESKEDGCVTVRDRDTMEQVRIPISELKAYVAEKIAF